MVPNMKKQAVRTIEQWTTAFNTFVAVYTKKYRDEAPSLMKYCSIIRELVFQSANWKFYDENVRLLRQKEPWPWHQIHSELYLRAHLNKNNSNPSNQGTRPQHKANGAPFQRGFVGHFTMVNVVQGAPLSTSAISAAMPTQFPAANKTPNQSFPNKREDVLQSQNNQRKPILPLPTPIKVDKLALYLHGYNKKHYNELIAGFTFGFKLHYQSPSGSTCMVRNLVSAYAHPDVVESKLAKELELGQIKGPFANPPFLNFFVSPLGVVPKKTPGEYRMIHHLSFPHGVSVNDFIPPEHASVKYATVDDAVRIILKRLGKGCAMAKMDLFGFGWKGKWYYDCCIPMGARSSCQNFDRLSSALEWLARAKLGIPVYHSHLRRFPDH